MKTDLHSLETNRDVKSSPIFFYRILNIGELNIFFVVNLDGKSIDVQMQTFYSIVDVLDGFH